jgi:squalene-hopene/tetraprenyl-beta-curcumene cyclase
VDWLVRTQRPDGSWDEPQFTGTGFPGDFYLNYHLYRLAFPVSALGRFAEGAGVVPREAQSRFAEGAEGAGVVPREQQSRFAEDAGGVRPPQANWVDT